MWTRYYRTIRSSIVQLPQFAEKLPREGSVGPALAFALLPTAVTVVSISGIVGVFGGSLIASSASSGPSHGMPAALLGVLLFLLYTSMAIGAYLGYLALWPLVLVGVARVLGSRELQYQGAFRCLCYSSGLNWLNVVPCIGIAASLYHVVVAAFTLGAMSRTSALKGFAIYLAPSALMLFCCGGVYAAFMLTVLGTSH